jgi:DnaJ-class molecular chaperone
VLGLRQGHADAVAVKKAYFERARECHPDLNGATPENVKHFQELSLAVNDILRELAGDSVSSDADAAGEATGSAADVARDDPNFASSYWEHISKEMSASTRAEIKAAVKVRFVSFPVISNRKWRIGTLFSCMLTRNDGTNGSDGWWRVGPRRVVGGRAADGG